MPIGWDESAPADTASIPAYPANARAQRAAVKAAFGVEHDDVDGRHKFAVGVQAVQDALTGEVDGTPFFLVATGGLRARVNYAALGGWVDVIPPPNYAQRNANGAWEIYQYITPVTVSPTAGSPNPVAVSSANAPAKKVTLSANSILSNPGGPAFIGGGYTTISVEVIQNGTGGWTLAFASEYVFAGRVPPLISTAANSISLLTLTQLSNSKWLVTCAPDIGV